MCLEDKNDSRWEKLLPDRDLDLPISVLYTIIMGKTVIKVDRTCGPTHLSVLFGNKICLN